MLMGKYGVGKTTLFNKICGIDSAKNKPLNKYEDEFLIGNFNDQT